ncbi:hypothetical protein AB0M97_23720 [Streptomyces sp. NPDC051207]|uniref:hypothetical protein n=1 Tax=Streptomyces sp. NPDC051207 TaxID=3154641 RepID=UPI003445FB04
MRAQRSLVGVIGVLAMMLLAAFSTGTAQAATSATGKAGGQVLVAPAAPKHATALSAQRLAAASPTVSPAANYIHRATGESYTCASGNLCTEVWDPTVSKWKIFFLYHCNRYSLANWLGGGYYHNFQTGGATAYFYDSSGRVITTSKAVMSGYQDWNPVWSIRNC